MKFGLLISALALAATTACAPPTRYHWGNYESSLYRLMKDPTNLNKYGVALNEQITKAETLGKVPPGIYAEYGYFLVTTQKHNEAVIWFQKEKTQWPESALLMDKMISNCQNPKANPDEVKTTTGTEPLVQATTGSAQ